MLKIVVALCGCSALALLNGTSAFAQNAPQDTNRDSAFGDIIVTARKTQETQQTVPIAITALGGEALKERTIQSVRDIQFNVAGLVNYPEPQGGAPDFGIRGTKMQGITGSQGGVAVYLGYVPLTSTMSIKNATFDMQSVQVLKGPQGTLFGKNTTGGAIIFTPNAPSDVFEGFVTGQYGNWDRKDLTAMVNVPITTGVALRVAGRIVKRDGRVKNIIDPTDPDVAFYDSQYGHHFTKDLWAEDNQSLRVSLRLQPTDNITNTTVFDYYHQSKDQTDMQAGFITTIRSSCDVLYSGCASDFARQQAMGFNKTQRLFPVFVAGTWWGVSNTTEVSLGNVTIRNIFGYRDDKIENSEDDTGVDAPLLKGWNRVPARAYTDEINIIGKLFDDKLDYTLGAFYSDQKTNQQLSYQVFNNWRGRLPFLPPWHVLGPRWTDNVFFTKSIAAFGQLNYHIDDRLTFTFGGRYTKTKLRYHATEYVGLAPGLNPDDFVGHIAENGLPTSLSNLRCTIGDQLAPGETYDPVACLVKRKKRFNSFIFNAGMQYQADPRTMIYVSVSKGYQAGGFNASFPIVKYQTFNPETVLNFEAGLKKDWFLFNQPIRTNVAAFYAKYKNQQRNMNGSWTQADVTTYNLPARFLNNTWTGTFNAADSTTWGFELDVAYNVTDRLKLSGFYTYINAKYDSFAPPPIGSNQSAFSSLSGRPLAQTPKHTLGGNISYSVPMNSDAGELKFALNAYYRSRNNTSDVYFSGLETTIPGYAVVNGRIDLLRTLPVDVGVWANNLFNKRYAIYKNETLGNFGLARTDFGEPRSYGVDVTFRF